MASNTRDTLSETFRLLAADSGKATAGVFAAEANKAADALVKIGAASSSPTPTFNPLDALTGTVNSIVPPASNVSPADTGPGVGSTVLSVASKVFESGLGLVSLVSGLLGLFGGGGASAPPPLVKYAMPEQLYFTGATTSNGIGGADYDQTGMPRAYSSGPAASNPPGGSVAAPSGGGIPAGGSPPQINVTVQAMDAQSFLDHSSEIAQAVRYAMLNLSSINDVVNDL